MNLVLGAALNLGSFFAEMTSIKLSKLTPSCKSVSKSFILMIRSLRNVLAHPVNVFFCTSIHDLRGVVDMDGRGAGR